MRFGELGAFKTISLEAIGLGVGSLTGTSRWCEWARESIENSCASLYRHINPGTCCACRGTGRYRHEIDGIGPLLASLWQGHAWELYLRNSVL